MTESTALIIGASRGLGLAMVEEYLGRGWRVVATVRGQGRTALHGLAGDRLEIETVDIADEAQIAALGARLSGRRFDLLFVMPASATIRRSRSARFPPRNSSA